MYDPTILLSREHDALLGQLDLLDDPQGASEAFVDLFRVLLRDSTVHFRREDVLLNMLNSRMGPGGNQLKSLMTEHVSFAQETGSLMELMTPLEGYSPFRLGPGLMKKLREFTTQFRAHIRHEETVVYLLAKTRLTPVELRLIGQKILAL